MSHPTDLELLDFARQNLSDGEADSVLDHLSGCDECSEKVAKLEEEQLRELAGTASLSLDRIVPGPLLDETDFQRMVLAAAAETDDFPNESTPLVDSGGSERGTIPEEIGPYRLVEQIGEGGFGIVFRATQLQPIRRQVAIKLIKPGRDTRRVIARFAAERQALAMMNHPNIAQVFDAGATQAGHPYFAMELVDGQPITKHCSEHALPVNEQISLLIEVCRALEHAHQKGIIHRDVKPSNVLVTMKDGLSQVKVIDFGVAKALHESLLTTSAETRVAHIVGTPLYMSPEQASGEGIDTRTDVYGLGAMLYELLAGTTPFADAGSDSKNRAALMQAIMEEPPLRPSERLRKSDGPSTQAKLLERELDWIVLKALAKEADRRYQSAAELAADLERYLNGEAVLATPPTAGYRIRKFSSKYRYPLAMAATIFAVVVSGAAFSTWQAIRASRAESKAKAAAARRKVVLDFMVGALRSPSPIVKGRDVTIASVLENSLNDLLEEDQDSLDPEAKADMLYAIGESFQGLGLLKEARRATSESLRLRESTSGLSAVDTVQSLLSLSQIHLHSGDIDKCMESAREAHYLLQKMADPPQSSMASALGVLAQAHYYAGSPDEALPFVEKAIALNRELVVNGKGDKTNLLNELVGMNLLGQIRFSKGDKEEAGSIFEEAYERLESSFGAEYPTTIMALQNIAHVKMNTGKPKEAISIYEQCMESSRKINGENHMETILAIGNLAQAHWFAGERTEAIRRSEQGLELMKRELGEKHMHTMTSMYNLGRFHQMDGDLIAARKYLSQVKQLRVEVLGESHPGTIITFRSLGLLLVELDKHEEGVAEIDRYLDLERESKDSSQADYVASIHFVASELMKVKKYDLAADYFERCLVERKQARSEADVVRTANDLARSLLAAGREDEAKSRFEEAIERLSAIAEPSAELKKLRGEIEAKIVELSTDEETQLK